MLNMCKVKLHKDEEQLWGTYKLNSSSAQTWLGDIEFLTSQSGRNSFNTWGIQQRLKEGYTLEKELK